MVQGLKTVRCDLQVSQNNKEHRTSDLSKETHLFLRRGQEFIITLSFQNKKKQTQLEKCTLTTKTGPNPSKLNGTKNTFPISSLGDRKSWSARVIDKDQDLWIISITTPANAIIGYYKLTLKLPGGYIQELGEFMLLFNPWCEGDPVYLYNEAQRREYILNEDGIIYLGTDSCVQPHQWHFGQFEKEICDISIKFMDSAKHYLESPEEQYLQRNDPIYVSQVISDAISKRDEEDRVEFMVQNGQPSYTWISSLPILQQWFNTQDQPVYGHHWVFAAVLCTVLRCLGIPTRIVTNYNSAYDTNRTLKKDIYYNENGARIHRSRNDSIWHFHVWNECWMKRKDLPQEYSGWQVLDATAQHKYSGVLSCNGPAPVRAIKEGHVSWHYDVGLIFSKVVTDCVAWVRNSQGYFIKSFGATRYVGDSICTKSIGSDAQKDIYHKYKYPKGSAEEYEVLQRAREILLKEQQQPEDTNDPSDNNVILYMLSQNSQLYGDDIEIKVFVSNVGDEKRDLQLVMGAQSAYDYGITRAQFWSEKFHFHLSPGEERCVSGWISYSQYEKSLLDNNLLRITALVKQPMGANGHFTVAEQDVTVCKPKIAIQMTQAVLQFQPVKAMVVFSNPLNDTLEDCVIKVSGKGLLHKERFYRSKNVDPRSTLVYPITFTPTLAGTRRLYVQLRTSKLHSITGFQKLEVLPSNIREWSTHHWEDFQKSTEETTGSLEDLLSPLSMTILSENYLLYGQDFPLSLNISNHSSKEKDLCVVLGAQYIYENRDKCPHFWKQEIHFSLEAQEEQTLAINLLHKQYADLLWESNAVRLTGLVKDVTNTVSTSKNVTLYKPQLTIQMQKEALQYHPITATITITNPLDEVLRGCILTASGKGLVHKKRSYSCQDIDPGFREAFTITFTPTQTGALKLYMEFKCRQFCGVKSMQSVEVLPSEIPGIRG
ncbi:protein 4.2-like [Spea bombifrons]|uniref:protein 4.2-like n=1 Tax=Spea bombifrons TaxID=233779 RepID=UPI002349E850|nr:protein 4.2-like [Spea bombifrons]